MTAWLLIVGLYSHMYFVTFDGGNTYQNWQSCEKAAEAIGGFYNSNQPIVQDQILAVCTPK
jgi:hypothetical protein